MNPSVDDNEGHHRGMEQRTYFLVPHGGSPNLSWIEFIPCCVPTQRLQPRPATALSTTSSSMVSQQLARTANGLSLPQTRSVHRVSVSVWSLQQSTLSESLQDQQQQQQLNYYQQQQNEKDCLVEQQLQQVMSLGRTLPFYHCWYPLPQFQKPATVPTSQQMDASKMVRVSFVNLTQQVGVHHVLQECDSSDTTNIHTFPNGTGPERVFGEALEPIHEHRADAPSKKLWLFVGKYQL